MRAGLRSSPSPDGASWTTRLPSTGAWGRGAITGFNGIACGIGLFVAVGYDGTNGTILISSEGAIWTSPVSGSANPLNGIALSGIAYGHGQFVAVGNDVSLGSGTVLLTSGDGITWTNRKAAALQG